MTKLTVENLNNLFGFLLQQPDSVLWIRSKGYKRQLYLSQNFENIWGSSPDLFYQNPNYFEQTLLPEDREIVREMIQLDESGKIQTSYLYRIQTPKKEVKYIKDWHYLLTDERDIIVGIAGVAQQVSKEQWFNELKTKQKINSKDPQQVLQKYIFAILKSELQLQSENIAQNSPKSAGPELLGKNGKPIELTTRENECLYYLLAGKSAKQTAAIMNISQRTVEFHLDNIKLKAGCRTKLELLSKTKVS